MTTSAADETRLDDQATQAAPVTEPSADPELAELARWLDEPEATQDDAVQNPEPDETESDATTGDEDPELEAAVQARAERLAEEKAEEVRTEERQRQDLERKAQIATNQWNGVVVSFRERAPRIRAHLNAVRDGTQELNIDGVLNEFNEHHAKMVEIRDYDWHEWLFNNTVSHMSDADKERVTKLKSLGQLTAGELLEERDRAVGAKSREGLHTEARLKEEHSKGALAYRSRLEKMIKDDPTGESVLALLRSRTTPAASRNTNTPAPTRTGTNVLTDPNSSMADVNRLLAEAGV